LDVDEVSSVLLRVRSGDDVAGEMRREYEAFLNLYRERLAGVTVDSGSSRDDGKLGQADQPRHMQVKPLWTNDRLQQPGNLRIHNQNRITLLDGWRTVIQIDRQGNEQMREELDLEEQESISVVRSGDRQPELSVVFSAMSRTVRVLDPQLKTIQQVQVEGEQQRIRDANLLDLDNDGRDELLVSFTGPRGTESIELDHKSESTVDPANQVRQVSPSSIRSAAVVNRADGGRSLIFSDSNAALMRLDLEGNRREPVEVETGLVAVTQVISVTDQQGGTNICAIGTNKQGNWTAIGLDLSLTEIWSVPIGNQRFDTQIEPVSFARASGAKAGIWCIAGADGSIKLIRHDGKLVDNWNIGQSIHGIQLLPSEQDQYTLLLCTEGQVQGWAVQEANEARAMPASTGR